MKFVVTLIANVLEPLDLSRNGMEISTRELIELLVVFATNCGVRVVAHEGSRLPRNAELIPAKPNVCPEEYRSYGGGVGKWNHVANDAAVLTALMGSGCGDIVHDCSSSVSACLFAHQSRVPCIKTLRLHPSHPSNVLTAAVRDLTLYISDHQRTLDRWTGQRQWATIRDMIFVGPIKGLVDREDHLVSVGRVEPSKGLMASAKVAGLLGKRLRIIGEAADTSYARELANMRHVELVGGLSHERTLTEISRAHALVWTPSLPEPGGRVVIEALRLSTPVYGFAFGHLHDVVSSLRRPAALEVDGESVFLAESLPAIWGINAVQAAELYINAYNRVWSGNSRSSIGL